jgi:hypothetical protein
MKRTLPALFIIASGFIFFAGTAFGQCGSGGGGYSPPPPPYGSFDGISTGSLYQNQTLSGSGWATATDGTMGAPVNEVDILLDGWVVCQANLGDYRPDVQDANANWAGWAPGFDISFAGWDFSYNIGGLSPGDHTLTAIAYDDNWNATQLNNTWTFTVYADPAPTPAVSVESSTTVTRPYHGSVAVTVRYTANDPAGFLSGIRYNVWNPSTGYFDNGGGGFASESGTDGEVDRTVTLNSDGTWYFWTDAQDCFGNYATTGAWWSGYTITVVQGAPPPPPTIAWAANPASVVAGQPYTIGAQASDSAGALASISITKNGQPFASSGGGNGTASSASGSSSDVVGTDTYTASATDSYGFVSNTLTWTVTVAKATPAVANWTNRAIANNNGYTVAATDLAAIFYNSYDSVLPTPPAAPVLNPSSGTYTAPLSVSITDSANGAAIYYTTDGTTPTTSSTRYNSPVSLPTNATTTINAIAVNSIGSSTMTSGRYTVNPPPPPAAPVINPSPGTYTAPQSVSITDSTNGVAIYYTTNGTTPTTSLTLYSGPFSLPVGTTLLQAVAVNSGGSSSVTSGSYTVNLPPPPAAPVFNPSAGTYAAPPSITITAASGATIRYTTNGTMPTTSSTVYSGPFSLPVGTTLLQAIAINSGGSSGVTSGSYTVNPPPPPDAPVFSPSPGTYTDPQSVSITDSANGVAIYYTTDGTTPTTSSTVYSGPVSLPTDATTTINAIAVNGNGSSTVASGSYTVNSPPPPPPPPGGPCE